MDAPQPRLSARRYGQRPGLARNAGGDCWRGSISGRVRFGMWCVRHAGGNRSAHGNGRQEDRKSVDGPPGNGRGGFLLGSPIWLRPPRRRSLIVGHPARFRSLGRFPFWEPRGGGCRPPLAHPPTHAAGGSPPQENQPAVVTGNLSEQCSPLAFIRPPDRRNNHRTPLWAARKARRGVRGRARRASRCVPLLALRLVQAGK